VAGITKQALHQHQKRLKQKAEEACTFFEGADKIREEHPGVGCRKMARELCQKGWGRDKVEQLLLKGGYRLCYPRSYVRTTYAQTDVYYPNLIEGLELSGINQVVQTDLTYFKVKERFFYIIFLIDVYSRRITGYAVSKTMEAEANIRAVKRLLATRKGQNLCGMIHHSDRGSQYIDREYGKLLEQHGIKASMCKAAWENAYTERVNRTIKEEYLDWWSISDYPDLVRCVNKAVKHYNTKRKHESLGDTAPVAFENYVKTLPPDSRPKVRIYKKPEQKTDIY
jgi:putative transposase